MALSKCPKCDSHRFETTTTEPQSSDFKLIFVQCVSCGAVVGVLDFFNIGNIVQQHSAALKAIADHLGVHVKID